MKQPNINVEFSNQNIFPSFDQEQLVHVRHGLGRRAAINFYGISSKSWAIVPPRPFELPDRNLTLIPA